MLYVLLSAEGVVARFPYSITQLRIDHPDTSFGEAISGEALAGFGVHPVVPADPPTVSLIGRSVHADPLLVEGEWVQQWAIEALSIEDAKTVLKAAIEQRRDHAFRAGFTPSTGPLAGKTLQVRDNDDRTNWLTSQASYSAAVVAGQGATMGAEFRTASNETITCTYLQGLQTLLAMAAWGKAIMGNSWVLKDAAVAATDLAVVAAIDVAAGWP